jgi:flagellar protein FliO/FliZ
MLDTTFPFRTPERRRSPADAAVAGITVWALPLPLFAAEVLSAGRVAQTLLTLAVVVGLIFALAWMARRMPGLTPRAAGEIRIVDALALSARERLLLVEVAGERLLLATAPGRIARLHVVGTAAPASDFPSALAAAGVAEPQA